jgi:hypothetical protein
LNITYLKEFKKSYLYLIYVVLKIALIWGGATAFYYEIFPRLGINLSYNSSPVLIAFYYFIISLITILSFKNTYSKWAHLNGRLWFYGVQGVVVCVTFLLSWYFISFLPNTHGLKMGTNLDLVLATPWYFLPKVFEILVQQLLIVAFVIEFNEKLRSLKKIVIAYIVCFVGAHVILYIFNKAPKPYTLIMVISAFLSAFVLPYLLLKTRRGFIYTYILHFLFYIALAFLIHDLPGPGYFA